MVDGLVDVVDGLGVRALEHVDAADVGLVALDGVARQYSAGGRVVDEVAIVAGVVADEEAGLGVRLVVLLLTELLLDVRVAWRPPYS